ncbi:MAG: PHP domain-containing protein [Candidatus Cloacimonetes bacterium]|nr:PHP domain-containing protein [Candidatus Cloacimonadota bacterium]
MFLTNNPFWYPGLSFIPFFFSYAEIHYHYRFLYPRYFRKEPEIIADLPIRCIRSISSKLPVLIIVKDSHLFPIELSSISVDISANGSLFSQEFNINEKLTQKYYSRILEMDISTIISDEQLSINVTIRYQINGNKKTVINDNYPGLKKTPFECYLTESKLPVPEGWYAGEPHYHSIYTSDQVEFGADIPATVKMAKAIGLSWLFITDHSYDLDDSENSYTINDPDIPKWEKMFNDVHHNDEKDFRVIPGEEVSIGNSKGRNVHLLAINHPAFIEGAGDSAEKWFRNKPQRYLQEIEELHSESNLFIAAHPNDDISFLQKLTLRRGNWSIDDYQNSGIRFLQLINTSHFPDVLKAVNHWRSLLLQGNRFYILAGNDAHGNFNVMRQIKTPFWKLFTSHDQVFGKFFTTFKYKNNDPIQGIKNGELIVSNGPFLSFQLKAKRIYYTIGSTIKDKSVSLEYETRTAHEFGEIRKLSLYIGDTNSKKENKISNPQNSLKIELPARGYVRMSMSTSQGGFVLTNPVWVE